jgi:hypothetical protein
MSVHPEPSDLAGAAPFDFRSFFCSLAVRRNGLDVDHVTW